MRLAVLQSPSPGGDLGFALRQVEWALASAAAARADVLVAPEVFLPGYNHPDLASLALTDESPVLRRLARSVEQAGIALVIGLAEAHAGGICNTALCLGPDGGELARYRKIQLFGPREKAIFTAGDSLVTFDLAGHKAALLICYDVEFAPHVAALAARGVRVILVPTANMVPYGNVNRHTVPATAANHGLAIAYANYCGAEGDLTYVGGSLIAGPHGEVLAMAGEFPALLVATVPATDHDRASTQAADFRRPVP